MLFIFRYLNLYFAKGILSPNKVFFISTRTLWNKYRAIAISPNFDAGAHLYISQKFLLVISIYDYLCQPKSKR